MNLLLIKDEVYASPLPRYMGSKRKFCSLLSDMQKRDAIIEPFAGAAHYSFYLLSQGWVMSPDAVFLGEADASVRAIYLAWIHGLDRAVVNRLEQWRKDFTFESTVKMWAELSNTWQSLTESDYPDIVELAAASLAIRKLTFGGMVRTNKSDRALNIKWVDCQLPEFTGWDYKFPSLPPADIYLASSWERAISEFKDSDLKTAEALIDPPYWSVDKKLTGCYPGHEPSSEECFNLGVDAFRACLEDERINRITITNYFSDRMDSALRAVAAEYGCELDAKVTGSLDSVQKGKATSTVETQGIWTLKH